MTPVLHLCLERISGTPTLSLPDALLCFQLCVEIQKGISRLQDSLKNMRGGEMGQWGWGPVGHRVWLIPCVSPPLCSVSSA